MGLGDVPPEPLRTASAEGLGGRVSFGSEELVFLSIITPPSTSEELAEDSMREY